MKILYAIMALLLVTGINAHAQQGRDTIRPAGDAKTEGNRKKMMEDLKLTKLQAKQFKEVNQEFAQKIKALRADSTIDKKTRRQQLMDLMKQREDKLKTFLTPEQVTKMHDMQQEQMKNRRKGGKDDMEETSNQ